MKVITRVGALFLFGMMLLTISGCTKRSTLPVVSTVQAASDGPTFDNRHRISVNGESLINVAPDRILITLGVDTRDFDLNVAKQQNDTIVRKAIASIKDSGVAAADIQTDQLSIDQRFITNNGRQVFDGFTVRNMFVVTLKDPAKVESVISKALGSGVNYLLGVDFQTKDLKKYREQARKLAVQAAKEKAELMAAELGESVSHPIQISEGGYSSPSYYSSWSGAGWNTRNLNSGVSQNSVQVSGGAAEDTIALGKVGIRANVSVVFELTP